MVLDIVIESGSGRQGSGVVSAIVVAVVPWLLHVRPFVSIDFRIIELDRARSLHGS